MCDKVVRIKDISMVRMGEQVDLGLLVNQQEFQKNQNNHILSIARSRAG